MFVEHQEIELSEVEVSQISGGSKVKTQVKVCWQVQDTLFSIDFAIYYIYLLKSYIVVQI